jgi:hypothetical protein
LLAGIAVLGLAARGVLDGLDRWRAANSISTVPAAQLQRFTRFDDGMALVAYDLRQVSARAGAQLPLRFYLEATRPMAAPASVFVHLYGADAQLWGQGDQPDPLQFFPTTRWPLGQPLADDLTLTIKPGAPPGRYSLAVGLWNRATGERSHPLGPGGQPIDQDKLTLSDSFQITP